MNAAPESTSFSCSTAITKGQREWTQRYLPGRTAEITSVLLALGMGWLVVALGRNHHVKRGNP
jgi:hypothetical protein